MKPDKQTLKQLGAVFTSPVDADILVANLPEDKIRSGKIMDLCCGEGALILAVVRRALALGCEPDDIAQRIYGSDIVQYHVDRTIENLELLLGPQPILKTNFVCEDSLTKLEK